jgi:death-on-curing protein
MTFILLNERVVDAIHDDVLNPGELTGRADDKSLDGTLARVQNRLAFGMIADVFELAATYALVISQGHCFNDSIKRTAFRSMQTCLFLNGVHLAYSAEETADLIIRAAQDQLDEADLAQWLRQKAASGA